jgi:hypothetical protein
MAVGLQNMFGAIGRLFARTSVQRVIVICTVFVTVISAGAFITSDQFGLLQWLRQGNGNGNGISNGFGNIGQSNAPTGFASLGNDDPVKNFAKTGVGHVLFTAPSTDNCRRTLFDNRTGMTYDAGEMSCGQAPEAQNERLQSMGRPFKR